MTTDRASFHRILRGTAETLSAAFTVDGTAVDPGTVTVTITRADGTTLVQGGATGGAGAAPRTYALSTSQTALLDQLTITWTTANLGTLTTSAEIVGAHLFTISEARAFESGTLENVTTYPQSRIEEDRARITDAFEDICGVSFIPRYRYVRLDSVRDAVELPDMYIQTIRSFETRSGSDWTAYDQAAISDLLYDDTGQVWQECSWLSAGRQTVRVGYEYGYRTVPLEIHRAALRLLVSIYGSTQTNFPERATSMSDEFGTFSLATPGLRGSHFGLPEIDAILNRHRATRIGIG